MPKIELDVLTPGQVKGAVLAAKQKAHDEELMVARERREVAAMVRGPENEEAMRRLRQHEQEMQRRRL